MKAKQLIKGMIVTAVLLTGCGTNEKDKQTEVSSVTTESKEKGSLQTSSVEKEMISRTKDTEETQESAKETEMTTETSEETTKAITQEELYSTDDYQKYIEAYNEFTMKGNPMPPEQRGSNPIPEEAGLTPEEYNPIKWGIHDYYGNALNEGLLTEKEQQKLMAEAFDKLMKGAYSSHKTTESSEVKEDTTVITEKTVTAYLRQRVAETVNWDIEFAPVELTETGEFKVHFYPTSPKNPNAKGYFIVTQEGEISRYSNLGGEKLRDLEDM